MFKLTLPFCSNKFHEQHKICLKKMIAVMHVGWITMSGPHLAFLVPSWQLIRDFSMTPPTPTPPQLPNSCLVTATSEAGR